MSDKRTKKRKNRVNEAFNNTLYGGVVTDRIFVALENQRKICDECNLTNCEDMEKCKICPKCQQIVKYIPEPESQQVSVPAAVPAVAPAPASVPAAIPASVPEPERNIEYYISQISEHDQNKEEAFNRIINKINTILSVQ